MRPVHNKGNTRFFLSTRVSWDYVASGWSQYYVVYVQRSGGTDERKAFRFIGFAWPMNIS
jgi:hypothetical protein